MSDLLNWLFGTSSKEEERRQPDRVPTDTVIRLPILENAFIMRNMFMNWTFRFDAVLDVDVLHDTLHQLVSAGPNWRKLGGRFRVDETGRLEMHIPAEFGPKRPAVQFTREHHDVSVRDHVLDGTMPRPEDRGRRPCVLDSPERLDPILAGPDAPRCFDDWLYADRSALVVHVITLSDATFVTLTYPHSLVDGVGKGAIVTEWCKVLAGRMADVAALAPWDADPMAAVAADEQQHPDDEPYLLAPQQLLGWHRWWYLFRAIRDFLGPYRGVKRQRNFYLPAASMARLRAAAGDPKLSDNQLLSTWLVRLACQPLADTDRPIGISSAVDLRGFLTPPLLDPSRVYLQNLLAYTWINTSAGELIRSPLGTAAQLTRTTLKPQLTWAQARASARLMHESFSRQGSRYYYTDRNAFVINVSSLAKARYWDVVDFGPAVVVGGTEDGEGCADRGKPVWQSSTPKIGVKPAALVVIQGKDREGNWWGQMVLPQRVWEMVEREFARW